jgi:hypothetical protein
MSSTVTMYYPFHPHAGQTVPVVSSPRHADGSYTVKDPAGFPLHVPVWMTAPPAAHSRLCSILTLSIAALWEVDELLALHGLCAPLPSSHVEDGGQHEATPSLSGSRGHAGRACVHGASDGRTHCSHEPDRAYARIRC